MPVGLPKYRPPTSPGEVLKKEYMEPLGISPEDLSAKTGIDTKIVLGIINSSVRIDRDIAEKLASAFGTSPDFWENLQKDWDDHKKL